MGSFREFGQKITALKGMGRVTRTMKMVASGYYRKAQIMLNTAGAYNLRLEELCRDALPPEKPVARGRRAVLLVISANRGLCGGYNGAVARKVMAWTAEHGSAYEKVSYVYIGKKAATILKESCPSPYVYETKSALPALEQNVRTGLSLLAHHRDGEYDDLFMVYTKSINAVKSEPVVEQLLPFVLPAGRPGKSIADRMILPETSVFGAHLKEQLIISRIYLAAVNSATAEQAARRLAMENASANIEKMILRYTLLRNSARQSSITRELSEIVSGAESLKG